MFSQFEVAIHEAAHVVVAGLSGVPITGAKVERCGHSEDFSGEVSIDWSIFPSTILKCNEEQRLGYRATRLGGPFAQFLYCGRKPDPRWLPDFAAALGVQLPSPSRSEYAKLLSCVNWAFCAAYRNPHLVVVEGYEELKVPLKCRGT
jgi:hypothetical protein